MGRQSLDCSMLYSRLSYLSCWGVRNFKVRVKIHCTSDTILKRDKRGKIREALNMQISCCCVSLGQAMPYHRSLQSPIILLSQQRFLHKELVNKPSQSSRKITDNEALICLASNQTTTWQIADNFYWILLRFYKLCTGKHSMHISLFLLRAIIEITIATIIIHDLLLLIYSRGLSSGCHVSSDKLVGLSLKYHRSRK